VPLGRISWNNGTFPLECFDDPKPQDVQAPQREATHGDFHYYVDPPVFVG
jgi:hypothetical protein